MHLSTHIPSTSTIPQKGGRVSSPKLRKSLEQSEDFLGLEDDTKRYDLLLLVKRVGKAAGFTSRMIELLEYYMSYTREIDWEEGHSPIVFQSLSRTALDLGISERQIQRLEQSLFDIGAITWHDSGNHRRYGKRCAKTGALLYAYGVDLTPLAYLREELENKLKAKKAYDQAWMEAKRQISYYRRQIRSLVAEITEREGENDPKINAWNDQYERIAKPIRTSMDVSALEKLLATHKELHSLLQTEAEKGQSIPANSGITVKMSFKDAANVAHYNFTNQGKSNKLDTGKAPPACFQGRRNNIIREVSSTNSKVETTQKKPEREVETTDSSISSTGLQHITLPQALNAASERFHEHMPYSPRPTGWQDLIEAAYRLRPELGISQKSWGKACVELGRTGAAICVLLTDQAALRLDDPVRKPAGYFNAMIQRATTGELHLHKSVFGILKREGAAEKSPLAA